MIPPESREQLEAALGRITDIRLVLSPGPYALYDVVSATGRVLVKHYAEDCTAAHLPPPMEANVFEWLRSFEHVLFPRPVTYSSELGYLVLEPSRAPHHCLSELLASNSVTNVTAEAFGRAVGTIHVALAKADNDALPLSLHLSLQGEVPPHTPIADAAALISKDPQHAPRQIILGGWLPGAVLFSDNRPVAFVEVSGLRLNSPLADVGLCLAYLLLHSGLSVQKARLFYMSFLQGYSQSASLNRSDPKLKVDTLIGMRWLLTKAPPAALGREVTAYRGDLLANVASVAVDIPENDQAFINALLGTGGINYGRLDGRVVSDAQIVYHKREGSEFSINVTNRCPNSCIFCIRDFAPGWGLKQKNGTTTNLYLNHEPAEDEVLAAVMAELKQWKSPPELIKFCGYGEPALRVDLILSIARILRECCPASTIQVNTSGWPLLKIHGVGILWQLKEAGVNALSVSLNAPDKATYDRIVRPGSYIYEPDAYELTLDCMKHAADLGMKVKATIVKIPLLEGKVESCRSLAEPYRGEFIVREFEGRELPGLKMDGTVLIEKEVKILDVDRSAVIAKLRELGAKHRLSGVTRLHHYDIPVDPGMRQRILAMIERNVPEFRRFYSVLSVIRECIRDGTTLYTRRGFLRIRNEPGQVMLIYKEPEKITDSVKREKEYSYEIESEEFGVALMHQWGLELTRFIEKNRESYTLDGVMFDIDTWPKLGTYLEVEAEDEVAIFQALAKVGIEAGKARGLHTESLFIERKLDPHKLTFSAEELSRLGLTRGHS